MSLIPIIRLRDNLIVSIQVDLTDRMVVELKESLTRVIQSEPVHGLVIEVSGVDVVDSYMGRAFRDLAQIAGLMGVRTVIAGLDAAMAITLVEMGLSMEGVATALNLESALDRLAEGRESVDLEDDFDLSGAADDLFDDDGA